MHERNRNVWRAHNDYFTHLYGNDFNERKEINETLAKAPKGSAQRNKIGQRLAKVREKLNVLPAVASKYQITLKGIGAISVFMDWARNPNQIEDGEWLPSKDAGDIWDSDKRSDSIWDGDERPDSVYIDGLKRSMDGYFARLKRRKWERETAGEGYWESFINDYGGADPIAFNDGRDEYQNWGYI